MTRQVAIIETYAECYRDIHEVVAAFQKAHGVWLNPTKVEALNPEGYDVEFVIAVPRFTVDQVRAVIDSVVDADDMNYHMKVQMFDVAATAWVCNGNDVRKYGSAVSNVMTYECEEA